MSEPYDDRLYPSRPPPKASLPSTPMSPRTLGSESESPARPLRTSNLSTGTSDTFPVQVVVGRGPLNPYSDLGQQLGTGEPLPAPSVINPSRGHYGREDSSGRVLTLPNAGPDESSPSGASGTSGGRYYSHYAGKDFVHPDARRLDFSNLPPAKASGSMIHEPLTQASGGPDSDVFNAAPIGTTSNASLDSIPDDLSFETAPSTRRSDSPNTSDSESEGRIPAKLKLKGRVRASSIGVSVKIVREPLGSDDLLRDPSTPRLRGMDEAFLAPPDIKDVGYQSRFTLNFEDDELDLASLASAGGFEELLYSTRSHAPPSTQYPLNPHVLERHPLPPSHQNLLSTLESNALDASFARAQTDNEEPNEEPNDESNDGSKPKPTLRNWLRTLGRLDNPIRVENWGDKLRNFIDNRILHPSPSHRANSRRPSPGPVASFNPEQAQSPSLLPIQSPPITPRNDGSHRVKPRATTAGLSRSPGLAPSEQEVFWVKTFASLTDDWDREDAELMALISRHRRRQFNRLRELLERSWILVRPFENDPETPLSLETDDPLVAGLSLQEEEFSPIRRYRRGDPSLPQPKSNQF
ncbi:hypothetical protein MD484_g6010, partial [Candolleomyces efflorescens]